MPAVKYFVWNSDTTSWVEYTFPPSSHEHDYLALTGGTITGDIIKKRTGQKSWILHSPGDSGFILAPSTSIDGVDWDWTKQSHFKQDGTLMVSGYNVILANDERLWDTRHPKEHSHTDIIYPKNEWHTFTDPLADTSGYIDNSWTNKFEFFPTDHIVQETSPNGINWSVTTEYTDAQLKRLVGGDSATSLLVPNLDGDEGLEYKRLTFTAPNYFSLSVLYLWVTRVSGSLQVKVEAANSGTVEDNYYTIKDFTEIGSWPAHCTLKHDTLWYLNPLWGGSYGHTKKVRLTFRGETTDGNYPSHSIHLLKWFGGYPNGYRNLYHTSENREASFPSNIFVNSNELVATRAWAAVNSTQLVSNTAPTENALAYWQASGREDLHPNASWWYGLRMSHGHPTNYFSATIATDFFNDDIKFRRITNGTPQSWRTIYHDGNINTWNQNLSAKNFNAENVGGNRIGFDIGDKYTIDSMDVAHYGLSWLGQEGIWLSGYYGIVLATNGTPRFYMLNDGRVGLNTKTPVGQFHSVGANGISVSASQLAADNNYTVRLVSTHAEITGYLSFGGGGGTGKVIGATGYGVHTQIFSNETEAIRITSAQAVGINITNPTARLQVEETIQYATAASFTHATDRAIIRLMTKANMPNDFWFGNNNIDKWSLTSRGSDEAYSMGLYNTTTQAWAWYINGTTNNMAIGTTANASKLYIEGAGAYNAPVLQIKNTLASTFVHSAQFISPNLLEGDTNLVVVGVDPSNKNAGYIGYKYSGTPSSNNNLLTFGHWASDHLMNLTGDGRLGINTGSPGSKVDISTGDNEEVIKYSYWHAPNSYYLKLRSEVPTGGVVRWHWDMMNNSTDYGPVMTFDRGNIGISTTVPATKLHVVGKQRIDHHTGIGSQVFNINTTNGTIANGSVIFSINEEMASGIATYYNISNQKNLEFLTGGGNTRMTIQGDGKVGIGTTTPCQLLDVNGYINIASQNGLRWSNGNAELLETGCGLYVRTWDGASLSTKMLIDGGGKTIFGSGYWNSVPDITNGIARYQFLGAHGTARIALWAPDPNGDADVAKTARLTLWASEPGISYAGVGIGTNMSSTPSVNGNGLNHIYDTDYGASGIQFNRNEIRFLTYAVASPIKDGFNIPVTINNTGLYEHGSRVVTAATGPTANLTTATQSEMEEGTSTTVRGITPQRVKQATAYKKETITSTSTLAASHAYKFILAGHASNDITITIPKDTYAEGTEITICRYYEYEVFLVGAADVDILSSAGSGTRKIAAQYQVVTLKLINTNLWLIVGGIA
jgi:hypothetical protein